MGQDLTTLTNRVAAGEGALGSDTLPRERAIALLDELLTFKLENRHLTRARETNSAGIRQSAHYQWMYGILRNLVEQAAPRTEAPAYVAQFLLGATYIDLIEELLSDGVSPETIRRAQAAFVATVMG